MLERMINLDHALTILNKTEFAFFCSCSNPVCDIPFFCKSWK